jgi:ABC-type multidrug transport system fused ATPase/permease subunit
VVLFAVNDTFRALVFLPELLKARRSIERLYKMNREFSPEVLQTLTFGEQLAEQNRLLLEQLAAETSYGPTAGACLDPFGAGGGEHATPTPPPTTSKSESGLSAEPAAKGAKPRKSISFLLQPGQRSRSSSDEDGQECNRMRADSTLSTLNRRLSNLNNLPTYMSRRRKSSRLNSLIPRSAARGRIVFRDVEFAYPNRPTALVLNGFTLSIEPGESVALVGASGSGKSTTVALLEKFYDYHAGSVTLDGRDLRLVEPNWVRSQIGLVQQEPCLLSYTIGDNIRYGDNSRFVSMDEVVEAARTANIHDFIMTLPDQYDTELSSSAYSSCQLSGGQRQRIAIARALIRQAPILIFDEATSALDNKSEQLVQDALRRAKRGRTNITIAHRLATVMDADKIVVMSDGRVVEVGRHSELIAKPNGIYRMLWARQAEGGGSGAT